MKSVNINRKKMNTLIFLKKKKKKLSVTKEIQMANKHVKRSFQAPTSRGKGKSCHNDALQTLPRPGAQ